MNWKLHFVWPLCASLSFAEAESAAVNLIETIYYDYSFTSIYDGIEITTWQTNGHEYQYRAAERNARDESHFFLFGFWHYGNKILSSGQTLNLSTGLGLPVEVQGIYGSTDGGSVSFGSNGELIAWDVYALINWESYQFWSYPVFVDSSYSTFRHLDTPDLYTGTAVYGQQHWAADNTFYFTNPGRWTASVRRQCWIDEVGGTEASCPDPVTPALVPLPPSLMLLASGLAGLGLVRRRRLAG